MKTYTYGIPIDHDLFVEMVNHYAKDRQDFSKLLGYSRTAVPAAIRSGGISLDMIHRIWKKFRISPNDYLKNGVYATWSDENMTDLIIQDGGRRRRDRQVEWKKATICANADEEFQEDGLKTIVLDLIEERKKILNQQIEWESKVLYFIGSMCMDRQDEIHQMSKQIQYLYQALK